MPTAAAPAAQPDELMGLYDPPRARTTLHWADWQDPIALRERLAEIHMHDFVTPSTLRTERAIVAKLKRMTGLDAETIRAYAREDAEMLIAAESENADA